MCICVRISVRAQEQACVCLHVHVHAPACVCVRVREYVARGHVCACLHLAAQRQTGKTTQNHACTYVHAYLQVFTGMYLSMPHAGT